jgi:Na+-transporting methylmalonyl-CoA/oxaloacetate decarboxylase beta subunit
MRDGKKKIILLIFSAVVLIIVLFIGNLFFKINEQNTVVKIIGGADGPTTIYISAKLPSWLILIYSVLVISIDLIIIAIINTIKHNKMKKSRYKIISIFAINLPMSIFLFPGMFVLPIIISIAIFIFMFIETKLTK